MKRAIAVTDIGNHWNPHARKSVERFAERFGAHVIVLNEHAGPPGIHPSWTKLFRGDQLAGYDQVLMADADILIHARCPHLFDMVRPYEMGFVGDLQAPHSADSYWWRPQIAEWDRRLNTTTGPYDQLNGGFWIYSPRHHQHLIDAAARRWVDEFGCFSLDPVWEQPYISAYAKMAQWPVRRLSSHYNRILLPSLRFDTNTPMSYWVEHFVGSGKGRMRKVVWDTIEDPLEWSARKSEADLIEGWFDKTEMEEYMRQCSRASNVLEIGCWKGRSTYVAASVTPGRVLALDWFKGGDGLCNVPETVRQYRANMNVWNRQDRLTTVIVDTNELEAVHKTIDSVFGAGASLDLVMLDADHSYEAVKAQIQALMPRIRPGGMLMGHDTPDWEGKDHWPGVTKAVRELLPLHTEGPNRLWLNPV